MRLHRLLALMVVLIAPVLGQTFDAVSLKPASPPADGNSSPRVIRGGPGSSDPGTATFRNIDLFGMVTMAYAIQAYQLSGPEWMKSERFDIDARVPAGATPAQYRTMLRALLAERFKLAAHFEQRQIQVYELTVAKTGVKMKESPGEAPADDDAIQPAPSSSPPMRNVGGSMALHKVTMEKLAGFLSGQLGQPVIDATSLSGRYDLRLSWSGLQAGSPAASDAPATPVEAVQEQLGLKLIAKRAPVEILVIDRAEKVPLAN